VRRIKAGKLVNCVLGALRLRLRVRVQVVVGHVRKFCVLGTMNAYPSANRSHRAPSSTARRLPLQTPKTPGAVEGQNMRYETNKKTTLSLTRQDAPLKIHICFPQPTKRSQVNPPAQRQYLVWLALTRLGPLPFSQSLPLVYIGAGTSLPIAGSSVTLPTIYGGWDGATTGHHW
jgi:hypothetical protein